jgi:non-heme chloroperoxidase
VARAAATRDFLRQCFARPLPEAELEAMFEFNMRVPREIRLALLGRPGRVEPTLKAITVPVLVTHGDDDRAVRVAVAHYTANTVKGAQKSIYAGIGHAPFWEDPARFNAELASFVRRVNSAPKSDSSPGR